MLFDFTINF